jgi:hypothetical protein
MIDDSFLPTFFFLPEEAIKVELQSDPMPRLQETAHLETIPPPPAPLE